MLTGADPFTGADGEVHHAGLDWGLESQHIFRDNLRSAAMCLLSTGTGGRQVGIDYAYVCWGYVAQHGPGIGIAVPDLAVPALLAATADDQITRRLTDYPATFDRVLTEETS